MSKLSSTGTARSGAATVCTCDMGGTCAGTEAANTPPIASSSATDFRGFSIGTAFLIVVSRTVTAARANVGGLRDVCMTGSPHNVATERRSDGATELDCVTAISLPGDAGAGPQIDTRTRANTPRRDIYLLMSPGNAIALAAHQRIALRQREIGYHHLPHQLLEVGAR